MIKLALLTTDNREQQCRYDMERPFFGTAPAALLEGLAQLGDEIEVHVISCTKRPMPAPPKLADNIWFHQVLVPHLGWGRTLFLGCAFAVRKVLRQIQPDLVHGQGTERDCAISTVLSGYPNLLTLHGIMGRISEFTGARFPQYYWLADKLERFSVARTDGLIAISSHTQRRFKSISRQIWLVPNACDGEFFKVEADGSGDFVLCVANIHAWKGQLELIKAMDELPDTDRPRIIFVGASGSGDYARTFDSLVQSRSWCEYRGHTSADELRALLAHARFLILPSFEDNCPMVILEAMAAGVPVIASRVGGIPDLVEQDCTGLLFNPQQPEDICTAIMQMQQNSNLRDRLATASKDAAIRSFHPNVIARKHLEIYHELLG